MVAISFDPIHSAILSMDLQAGIVAVYAQGGELVTRAGTILRRARDAELTIIHVKVGFRPGLPEIHERNMLLGGIKASPRHQQLFAGPPVQSIQQSRRIRAIWW